MMRLGRRTSLLVALYLLTSAAAAYAECAWVLWMSPPPKTSDLFWGPADSFQRLEECKRDTDRATGRQQAKPLAEQNLYVCLPDTVDPRGPKGK